MPEPYRSRSEGIQKKLRFRGVVKITLVKAGRLACNRVSACSQFRPGTQTNGMIGVIADDITGAAELGAIGLRYGLRAELLAGGPICAGADLVCLDTDSRSRDPEEAGSRAARAAHCLHSAGAEWIYKKVDSVLRGHVVAEAEAIRKQLGAARVVLAPANPGLGRTLRDGQYFIRGIPLHETDFQFDPEFPRNVADVAALLRAGETSEIRVRRVGETLPETGIAVAEVASAEDLRHWAARLDSFTLPAGAAEFFGAILGARGLSLAEFKPAPAIEAGPELFVCGSTSQSTREFLTGARTQGVPVFGVPRELACADEPIPAELELLATRVAAELGRHRRVVLALDLPPIDRALGPRMAARLAETALAVLERVPAARVFAEGGATAAWLVRSAGWQRLEVVQELAPGVVATLVTGQSIRRFTLKPGSYAWPPAILNGAK